MSFLLGILIGLAAGLAFRYRRAIEMKRALDARDHLLAVADRKVEFLAHEVVRVAAIIKALAAQTHTERVINLGGSVSLPDPARRSRQRVTLNQALNGPSNGGPHF
jgi:hypothetical protein